MSVFTSVTEADANALLERYSIGTLVALKGIVSGIENTNYFLTSSEGEYVLTLFEKLGPAELPYFLQLMDHLAARGVPCPQPVANRHGSFLDEVNDRPAGIVTRLDGSSLIAPSVAQCQAVGIVLANIHLAGRDFPIRRENERGAQWWKTVSHELIPHLNEESAALLQAEIRYQALYRWQDLPHGVIHADLFRDNVLFDGDAVSGVIDFYFACTDAWLYDLAITANDWCSTASGELDVDLAQALLSAYHSIRPLLPIERGAWPAMLRAGALRFWVSRLYDFHFPRPGEMTHAKDPAHFERILQSRMHASQRTWVNQDYL